MASCVKIVTFHVENESTEVLYFSLSFHELEEKDIYDNRLSLSITCAKEFFKIMS